MKIFFVSFPFEDENSGDYDYCVSTVHAINSIKNPNVTATYITSRNVDGYNVTEAIGLLSSINAEKNEGGTLFYDALSDFYKNIQRTNIVSDIFQYITSSSIVDQSSDRQNILNLQLRAPETGFLFSPGDLEYIKSEGFKVCITCHEYELNYSRKWLQTICHEYFKVADLVLFFSEQDKLSASMHAIKDSFLDTIFTSTSRFNDPSILLNSFSSADHSTLRKIKRDHMDDDALLVTNQSLTSLDCALFVGNIKFAKSAPTRCSFSGQTFNLSEAAAFELEYGIRSTIHIPKQDKPFLVSGIIVNARTTEELVGVEDHIIGKFDFKHASYNLMTKSLLTRVPPTTANIESFSVGKAIAKPPNIVIFGLIREGKGFEDALSIIQKIHNNYKLKLPDTRLIIVGKTFSFELLAKLINAKFGFKNVITDSWLSEIDNSDDENLESAIDKFIKIATTHKLGEITKVLKQVGLDSKSIEQVILKSKVSEIHKFGIPIKHLSKLQHFYIAIANSLPELLPIDFVLDVSKEDLHMVFDHAKYAIKYDEKGWANNASGLINLLAYGCILYTGYGMCTGDEVTIGKYKEAMVLPKGRYCLKGGEILSPEEEVEGRRMHFTDNAKKIKGGKQHLITSDNVIKDIITRENVEVVCDEYSDDIFISSPNNMTTLCMVESLLHQQFEPSKIAGDLIHSFENLFEDWI